MSHSLQFSVFTMGGTIRDSDNELLTPSSRPADPIGDVATFSDAATLSITEIPVAGLVQEEPPAGAATNFSDIAQFVVRDSEGNIKSQGVIE